MPRRRVLRRDALDGDVIRAMQVRQVKVIDDGVGTMSYDPGTSLIECVVLNEEYFVERNLYPNVDFYSGIIYRAIPGQVYEGADARDFVPARDRGRASDRRPDRPPRVPERSPEGDHMGRSRRGAHPSCRDEESE